MKNWIYNVCIGAMVFGSMVRSLFDEFLWIDTRFILLGAAVLNMAVLGVICWNKRAKIWKMLLEDE